MFMKSIGHMKISIFIMVLLTTFFVGCEKQGLENPVNLKGTWNLSNMSGGLAGINQDFNEGEVVWTFSGSQVSIKNNIDESAGYGMPETTTLNYSIQNYQGSYILLLNNQNFGVINLSGTSLSLDDRNADGFKFIFTKSL